MESWPDGAKYEG
jgi:hypothetical protein